MQLWPVKNRTNLPNKNHLLHAPGDTSSFEFHKSLVLLITESHSSGVDNGAYPPIALFLLEDSPKASDDSVAVKKEK